MFQVALKQIDQHFWHVCAFNEIHNEFLIVSHDVAQQVHYKAVFLDSNCFQVIWLQIMLEEF